MPVGSSAFIIKATTVTLFSEASTHNDAHTPPSTMSSNTTIGVETRAGKRKRELRDATAANAGEGFPGLPDHLVVEHIFSSEYFDDPADLAPLRVVSSAMRDAVTATGLEFNELDKWNAAEIGCLSAVQRLQRQGLLSHQELLCHAAARGGHLEELKVLCQNGTPWNTSTCASAARGGHLETLKWLRENSCLWDADTCKRAALGGHLEVLQCARANGCPWSKETCMEAAKGGHLEVLQWLRANGCPWDNYALCYARDHGHLELLNWAMANGLP
ncbi:ankyrin repeat domain-containing protein [bacterium]|nr:ankyrin repeat domain-containing protein [bacterium]